MRQTLNGWLWFVLGGCLFLWPSFSFADGPDLVQSYCADASRTFYHAARARMVGHARKIQAITHEQIEMMEHGIDFEFSKDAMHALGWDRLTKAEREETEMHAFAGWDSADRTLADKGAIDEDAVKAMARTYLKMCVDGHKAQPEAQPEKSSLRRTASSQKLYCENRLPFARLIARDLAPDSGLTIEQMNFANERDQRTAKDVDWCIKAGQELDACVQRRCMGVTASNDDGRERFRHAVRESLQRTRGEFERAHAGAIR